MELYTLFTIHWPPGLSGKVALQRDIWSEDWWLGLAGSARPADALAWGSIVVGTAGSNHG